MKISSVILIVTVFWVSGAFSAYDYTISSGYVTSITLNDKQTLLMTGGGIDLLTAYDHSIVAIENTLPLEIFSGGVWTLALNQNSRLHFSGGEVRNIYIYGDSTAVLSGGRIDNIRSYQRPLSGDYPPSYWDKHIEIICLNYEHNESTNIITGLWVDESPFTIQLHDQTGYFPAITNIEFTVIPEPTTLLLLSIGGGITILQTMKRKK